MIRDVGDVLLDEWAEVHRRRTAASGDAPTRPAPPAPSDTDDKLQAYCKEAVNVEPPLSAICLSGGGIRSAAFAIGVLQALAKRGILDKFDYLSTVSGGGYAGSFLTAWIQRAGFDDVLSHLRGEHPTDAASPLRHLRRYSNYLNPHTSLFSADQLTNVVLYIRNLLLNWLVILPVVMLLIVLTKLAAMAAWATPADAWGMVAIVAVSFMGISFVDSVGQRPGPHDETADSHLAKFYLYEILPMLLGASLATIAAMGLLQQSGAALSLKVVAHLALTGSATALLACLIGLYFSQFAPARTDPPVKAWSTAKIVLAMIASWTISAAVIGLAVYGAAQLPAAALPAPLETGHLFVVLGPPVFILALFLGEIIYVAITNANDWGDAEREWLARAAGHHMTAAAAWMILFGLVLIGSAVFIDYFGHRGTATSLNQTAATLAGAGSLAGAVTALLARAKDTAATLQKQVASWKDLPRNLIMAVATTVCVVFILIALSAMIDWSLLSGSLKPSNAVSALNARVHLSDIVDPDAVLPAWLQSFWLVGGLLAVARWLTITLVLVGLAALLVGLFASYFVNINRFSMHGVYRNRLIRTFLGASHRDRRPNELTDFDTTDNIDLARIWPGTLAERPKGSGALPPLLVVNMSLNVVGSSQLAWQERKAVSFTATPRWIGAGELDWSETDSLAAGRPATRPVTGTAARQATKFKGFYRAASDYGDKLSLGSTMTISGAAVSPNMGYNSSPAYSILMTLFNVRLGAWYGNPGPSGEKVYQHSGPIISAVPLVAEALGITTSDRRYVYLSDGGHFENLGIYEMIRRRCRLIVVSDGGEDLKMTFEDLGNAVRRAELDFGAQIRFETFRITGKVDEADPCFAIGEITYPEARENKGILVYVKPCRDDKAPISVRSYAALNEAFPHEPTTDQFFGETQFEAYRALGEHAIGTILPAGGIADLKSLLRAIDAAARTIRRRATAAPAATQPITPKRKGAN
ncbi:hypothetical protein SSBR45G_62970 [Bradyrhizobium sp. SSBR45G]|nr:hypothetical protein SSBR45G_62970 [Bradyrhizobium sp. SSBR45G]GLH85908.1 hypothetical protein SSBR45R_33680 [Bradyrhizobium sp. SSBR45R]